MGARIRAFDWAASPLGPPEQWPAPLRTALRILLTTNHPIFVFWGAEHICFYNDAYSRSLGPEMHPSMLGSRGREAWHEIWPIIGPQIEQVMAGRGATWHENQLVPFSRNGRFEDVYWTYSYGPIDDHTSPTGVGGVLVICTETTEHVLAEQRMRAAESRWRQLFEQAPGFMCVLTGPDHRFEYANPRYRELVGQRDILGKPVRDALPEVVAQGFIPLLDHAFGSGEAYSATGAPIVLSRHGAGAAEERFVDFVFQPIRDADGRVKGIFVEGADVTVRERGLFALRENQEGLQRSSTRLQLATAAAELGIHEYNLITGRLEWDARVRALWGVPADEPITYETFLAGLHPDDVGPTQAKVARALDPSLREGFDVEYRVIDRAGTMRWVRATGRVDFVAGAAERLVGTVQDVSRQKALEEGLREADRRKDEFLATLSHELRNPLASIRNAAHLLSAPNPTPDALTLAQQVLRRQVSQMALLLDDLLDVARLTQGKMELRRQRVTMASIVDASCEAVRPLIDANRHQLTLDLPSEPLAVFGDPLRLSQIFSNLLTNAAKYTDPGGDVRVTVRAEGGNAVVAIRDSGIGIPAANLKSVFDMFTQIKGERVRAAGGLGIGLALVKGLVAMHGGAIEAHSDGPGRGSEFRVSLPLVTSDAAALGVAPDSQTVPAPVLTRRVLVADDHTDAAESLASWLRMSGHEVVVANDGVEALASVASFRPDVALLDIGMPGLNGYDVARRLRQEPEGRAVWLVALTGWGQEGDKGRAYEAGFDVHLTKPIDPEIIGALLARFDARAQP
jgi:signal transduction histidine kinase/ActR/RegA family two-component response regulator